MFHTVTGNLDYCCGHLRYGHLELHLNDEEFEKFKSLSKDEQLEKLYDGNFVLDDYELDDWGSITDIYY